MRWAAVVVATASWVVLTSGDDDWKSCVVASDGCSGGLGASTIFDPSPTMGLNACPGSQERYLTPDDLTGAVVEICGVSSSSTSTTKNVTSSPGSVWALPVAQCGEARIGALAVDAESRRLYYSSGGGVRTLSLEGSDDDPASLDDRELVGAYGVVIVRGDSFGDVSTDLVEVRIRGQACGRASTTHVSRYEVRCVVGDPGSVGPRAAKITASCVTVVTVRGGEGGVSTANHAELNRATYGDTAPPAVFEVETTKSYAIRTRALAFDAQAQVLFFSSLGSPTGPSFGGLMSYDMADDAIRVVLSEAPRITGLAYDNTASSNATCDATRPAGYLYYADAARSLVARRPACLLDGVPGDSFESVLASNVREPRGLALDPFFLGSSKRVIYVTAGGSLLRVDDATLKVDTVVPETGRAAFDGVVVLDGNSTAKADRSRRLIWIDANRHSIRAATLLGTRVESLDGYDVSLRFPRAIARDESTRELIVGEWLGRIWRLPPPAQQKKQVSLLRNDDSTQAASTVRQTIDDELRRVTRLESTFQTVLLP